MTVNSIDDVIRQLVQLDVSYIFQQYMSLKGGRDERLIQGHHRSSLAVSF